MARFSPGSDSFRLGIRAYFHARTRVGSWWNGLPLHNEFWRLYYNEQPGMTLVGALVHHVVPPRRLVLIPPRFHGTGLVPGEMEHAFMHFDVIGLPHALISQLFPAPVNLPFQLSLKRLCADWLKMLRRRPTPEALPDYLEVEALACRAMAACWRMKGIDQQTPWIAWRNGSPQLASLETWISERLDQNLTIPTLAKHCSYSTDHFRRVFQQVFGMNPAAYVTHLRIKGAARFLMFGNLSIEEIADKTGFVDRHHFSRVFRKSTGQSPAAYRRQAIAASTGFAKG